MKAGFGKDGRLLALDMFVIAENSAYEASGDGGRAASSRSRIRQSRCGRGP